MTAPEQAEKIVDTYYYRLYEMQRNPTPSEIMYQSKECALILVDELLEEVVYSVYEDKSYWVEVKNEINKL